MNKAVEFAKKAVDEDTTPRYVKAQMREFLDIYDGKSDKFVFDSQKFGKIEQILKLLVMPKGLKAGKTLFECTCGYQWLFYAGVLCVVYSNDTKKRKTETALLEVSRKNFKTYTIAVMFILLFILEPKFSKFFSVAPDGALSREVKSAIEDTLKASPAVYLDTKDKPRFKLLRDYISLPEKEIRYTPLNYSNSRLDGRLPSVYLADEVGALPNNYAIEAMRSGQLNILNKLGCIISTKYPTANNPFEEELSYAKKVLDGIENDDSYFSLIYEPDDPSNWMTDDIALRQANPVSLEIPEIWDDLLKRRQKAIVMESVRENFLTKHMNIIYQGQGTETYVDVNELRNCKQAVIDWSGRNVYIGVDLAMTNDNTAVAMVTEEDGVIYCQPMAFIPAGRVEEKTAYERCDYKRFIENGTCIACGGKTVDYSVIEDYVFSLEEKYGVHIMAIGYDRFNALSSAQKWESGDGGKHRALNCVCVRQHSDTLHQPTKLLKERILNGNFGYTENPLYEINFENARVTYDTNLNQYVTKKKSKGKVDMVMATIDAVYLLQQDVEFADDFVVATF